MRRSRSSCLHLTVGSSGVMSTFIKLSQDPEMSCLFFCSRPRLRTWLRSFELLGTTHSDESLHWWILPDESVV